MVGSNPLPHDAFEDPYLGMLVAGVFELDALVGLGTTGRVYRATQRGFDRSVAVKVLHRHLMQTPVVRERFHREARLASRLNHPGIVRVLASGELDVHGPDVGGEAYLVSEYLEGSCLRGILQRLQRPLPLTEAISLMIAAGDAVGEAHAQQIIHRDLKPENLLLVAFDDDTRRLVVLDFGLARALDHQQDPLTHEGAILGTPQYMSPEAAHGSAATPRSDVYSLATILYELLTGHPPFTADSPMLVLMQQANAEPPPIAEHHAVPAVVQDFLHRQLEKSPDNRSPQAREFAVELFAAAIKAGLQRLELLLPQLSDDILEQLSLA
jgi:eukaryotic-like serine/threonine-protein kinase